MNLKLNSLAVITVALFYSSLTLAIPDYDKDKTVIFVKNSDADAINTANNILCYFGQTKYSDPSLLNIGWYGAKVDETLCDTNGDTSGAAPINPDAPDTASAPTEQQYSNWVVNSTQLNNNSPALLSAYVTTNRGDEIQAKVKISQAASDQTQQLGVFDLYFMANSVGRGMIRTTKPTSGDLENKFVLNFSESWTYPEPTQRNVVDIREGNTGYGSSIGEFNGQVVATNFAYNANYYVSQDANDQTINMCFDRNEKDSTAWQYGLYDLLTGARVNVNSRININTKADGSGIRGQAGEFGAWMDGNIPLKDLDVVYGQTPNNRSNNKTYDVSVKKGVLTKFTQLTQTLADVKNVPLEGLVPYWSDQSPGTQPQVISRVVWDQGQLNVVATATMNPGDRWDQAIWVTQSPTPVGLTQLGDSKLRFFSKSLGGAVTILLECSSDANGHGYNCTAPSASSEVISYIEKKVYPDEEVPALRCIRDCPEVENGELLPQLQSSPQDSRDISWEYSWANGEIFEGGIAAVPGDNFGDGRLRSGALFEPTTENLDLLDCRFDTSRFCPQQAQDTLPVYYVWSTGSNPWDYSTLFKDRSTGQFVRFEKPLNLKFTYPAVGVGTDGLNSANTDEKYAGSEFILEYEHFGNLHGIPGLCINPEDPGARVDDCSLPGVRYVPEFTIPALSIISSVDDPTKTYKVKPLFVEQRLHRVDREKCSGLTPEDSSMYFLGVSDFIPPNLPATPPAATVRVIGGILQ
jgi:hypothetical protein